MPLAQDLLGRQLSASDWISASAILAGAVILSLLVHRLAVRSLQHLGADKAVAHLVGRTLLYLVILVGFIYSLASLDIRISPLLGVLGIGGLALGLALQDILINVVSGVVLQVRRPFRRGDQIVTNEYEGTVEGINLRVVRIVTFDGENIYIPNSMVLQNPITNWTRTPYRRTTLEVGVAYDTDLSRAQQVMLEAVENAEGVRGDPAPEVYVYEFGESSINFAVRFWHRAPILDMWKARDAVAQAIKRAFDKEGITIPFPQRTVWFGPGNTRLVVRTETD